MSNINAVRQSCETDRQTWSTATLGTCFYSVSDLLQKFNPERKFKVESVIYIPNVVINKRFANSGPFFAEIVVICVLLLRFILAS